MKPFAYREREEDDFEIIETYQKKTNHRKSHGSSSSESDFEIIESYQDVLKRREAERKNMYPQPSNGIEAVGNRRNSMNDFQPTSPRGQISRPPSVSMSTNSFVLSTGVPNLVVDSRLHQNYEVYNFKPDFELEYIKRVEHEMKMEEEEEKRRKIKFNLLLQTLNTKPTTERNLMSPTLMNINENITPLPPNSSRPSNPSMTTIPRNTIQPVQSSTEFSSSNFYSSPFNMPTFLTEEERDSYKHAIEIGFSPDISTFATEAYRGDKIKVLDFLDKHKQLSEMNFQDLDIREALLLTDRSLDQSLDMLVQKSPNHYQSPNFHTSSMSQPSSFVNMNSSQLNQINY
ncbi:hypothetical protein FDP41_002406 [Naegleria fowleri]|uniref:Uncharacterized protein n=1 Tax=Naegleria fowleri TaxID=5763 RepID=A0A6A5BTP9_NAEFO|nr:uncharacterized protein FDP41_002406 [Naegleria fowleri]KAF0978586.1 hypothetical protein FDP41_002406 [Naegleria fowleri]